MRSDYGSEAVVLRDTAALMDGTVEVAGVRWLGGAPSPERAAVRPAATPPVDRTFVIGRAHGPRLLELLCAAG